MIVAVVGVVGLSVKAGTINSSVVVKHCKSLLDTRCLTVFTSPIVARISIESLSLASPISKLKNSFDLLAHKPSGCDTVPANHNRP